MYCNSMVKRKKTEETKTLPRTAVMDTQRCVYRRNSETYAQSTLHDRSKFNIDVLPRQTYCQ